MEDAGSGQFQFVDCETLTIKEEIPENFGYDECSETQLSTSINPWIIKEEICEPSNSNDDLFKDNTGTQELILPEVAVKTEDKDKNLFTFIDVNSLSDVDNRDEADVTDALQINASVNKCRTNPENKSDFVQTKHLRTLPCEICKKHFDTTSNLIKHQIVHYGVRPYICDICKKTFATKRHLIRHLIVHSRVKSHTCDTCKKSFATNNHLRRHQVVHSRLKAYTCETCKKSYTQKGSLDAHNQLVHSGLRVYYTCDTCNKSFDSKSHLVRHQIVHSDNKPYTCGTCNKSFGVKSSLIRHEVNVHSIVRP